MVRLVVSVLGWCREQLLAEDGATLTEYVLLLTVILVVSVLVLTSLGATQRTMWTIISDAFSSTTTTP